MNTNDMWRVFDYYDLMDAEKPEEVKPLFYCATEDAAFRIFDLTNAELTIGPPGVSIEAVIEKLKEQRRKAKATSKWFGK